MRVRVRGHVRVGMCVRVRARVGMCVRVRAHVGMRVRVQELVPFATLTSPISSRVFSLVFYFFLAFFSSSALPRPPLLFLGNLLHNLIY